MGQALRTYEGWKAFSPQAGLAGTVAVFRVHPRYLPLEHRPEDEQSMENTGPQRQALGEHRTQVERK
jgi:hypothetical protein